MEFSGFTKSEQPVLKMNGFTVLKGQESDPIACKMPNLPWLVLRLFVAAILLVAAGLKAHQLATTPSLGGGVLETRWFNIFVVEFELLFGIWLVFGMLQKLTWIASVALFSIFATVSALKGISGEASCGCFGKVTINPWLTAGFDLAVVGLLIWVRLRMKTTFVFRAKNWAVLINLLLAWMMIALPLGWTMATFEPSTATVDGRISGTSNAVILNPVEWLNQDWPILDFVETDKNLRSGRWVIILYGADCHQCHQYVMAWKNSQFPVSERQGERVLMLEMSGNPENEFKKTLATEPFLWGNLSYDKQWYVKTPVVLLLQDGVVERIWTKK